MSRLMMPEDLRRQVTRWLRINGLMCMVVVVPKDGASDRMLSVLNADGMSEVSVKSALVYAGDLFRKVDITSIRDGHKGQESATVELDESGEWSDVPRTQVDTTDEQRTEPR